MELEGDLSTESKALLSWVDARRKVASNRALCLLKLDQLSAAVQECEVALSTFPAVSPRAGHVETSMDPALKVKVLHNIIGPILFVHIGLICSVVLLC